MAFTAYRKEGFSGTGRIKFPWWDTTAAGDTFARYFVSSVVSEKSVEESLENASVVTPIAAFLQGAAVSIPGIERFYLA